MRLKAAERRLPDSISPPTTSPNNSARRASGLRLPPAGPGASPAARPALAAAMSRYAGVVRDADGLAALLRMLERAPSAPGGLDLATAEATSLHTVSVLVAVSALARTESRGCHRWRDVPATSDDGARHTVLRVDEGRVGADGAVLAGTGAGA